MEQPTLQPSAICLGLKTYRHPEDPYKSFSKLEDRIDAGWGPGAAATTPSQTPPLRRPDNRAILRFCYVSRRQMAKALTGILVSLEEACMACPAGGI